MRFFVDDGDDGGQDADDDEDDEGMTMMWNQEGISSVRKLFSLDIAMASSIALVVRYLTVTG